jgi:hypothetical protein
MLTEYTYLPSLDRKTLNSVEQYIVLEVENETT